MTVATDLSEKSFLTIKPIGFNEQERIKFASILNLAERRLDKPWQLTEAAESDFYLLPEHLKLLRGKDNKLTSLPLQKCIFYTNKNTHAGYHELLVDKNKVPSLKALVELFNNLSAAETVLEQKAAETTITNIEIPADGERQTEANYFDPERGFLGILLSNADGIKEYILKTSDADDNIYVDRKNKLYYYNKSLENLEPFFSEYCTPSTHNISEQQLQELISCENLKAGTLRSLLWFGAFISSKGKLIKGHDENAIVRLKRWPDINLPGSRKLIKLAAFMQSNSVDLNTIQQRTHIPVEQIYDFFNACKIIDLIEYSQQIDVHNKQLDDSRRQLYAMIEKRLNASN
ncbi:MAG: hypothetical protein ACU837_13305 [Gammaproteobacteria bacterium]